MNNQLNEEKNSSAQPNVHKFKLRASEILSSKKEIETLVFKGKFGVCGNLKYSFVENHKGRNRILVSVPKRNFKRAVKRNLLKRRIREAYRLNKFEFKKQGIDIMFFYITKQVVSSDLITKDMKNIATAINKKVE